MKVLIVDDAAVIRTRLDAMLGQIAGVEVVGVAENARGAVEAIDRLEPDVVVLDVQLPDGTGMDVLMALRGKVLDPKIIMITNYPYPAYRERCLALGADYFFDKSSEFIKAIDIVENLAAEWRLGAQPSGAPGQND